MDSSKAGQARRQLDEQSLRAVIERNMGAVVGYGDLVALPLIRKVRDQRQVSDQSGRLAQRTLSGRYRRAPTFIRRMRMTAPSLMPPLGLAKRTTASCQDLPSSSHGSLPVRSCVPTLCRARATIRLRRRERHGKSTSQWPATASSGALTATRPACDDAPPPLTSCPGL
jgi:hypothetical protein